MFTALGYGLKAIEDGHSAYHTLVTTRLYLWTGNSGAGLTSDNYRKLVEGDDGLNGWSRNQRYNHGVSNEIRIESYYLVPRYLTKIVLALLLRRPADILHGTMLVKMSKPPSPQLLMPFACVS